MTATLDCSCVESHTPADRAALPKSTRRNPNPGAAVAESEPFGRAFMLGVNGCWREVQAPWRGHSADWNAGGDWRQILDTGHELILASGMPWFSFFIPHDRDPADPATRYVVCAKGSANRSASWGATAGANPPANGPDECGLFAPMLLQGFPALLLFLKQIPACPPPWVPAGLHDLKKLRKRQRREQDQALATQSRREADAARFVSLAAGCGEPDGPGGSGGEHTVPEVDAGPRGEPGANPGRAA